MTELMKRILAKLTDTPQTLDQLGCTKVTLNALIRNGLAATDGRGYVVVHQQNAAPITHTSFRPKTAFGDGIATFIKSDQATISAAVGNTVRFNLPNGREVTDSIVSITENIYWLKSGMVVLKNDDTLKLI